MATYNSAKYLEECLKSVFQSVPVNRLIVADHDSTDGTLEILEKYDALILPEQNGLGYARQLTIDKSETPIITFIDSDVIFESMSWWYEAYATMKSDVKIGAVCSEIDEDRLETPRMKYLRFWNKVVPSTFWNNVAPFTKRFGLTLSSTLIKRDLIKDIRIPAILDAREDRFLELNLLRKGYCVKYVSTRGTHYFDYSLKKAHWSGANTRLFEELMYDPEQANIFWLLCRRLPMAFLKGIPPALYYRDPVIIVWNAQHWWGFLRGWLEPYKYRKHIRSAGDKHYVH